MQIGVDLTPLLLRSAGVKSYLYYWFRAMQSEAGSRYEIRGFPSVIPSGPLMHDRSILSSFATLGRLAAVHGIGLAGSAALDAVLGNTDIFHTSNMTRAVPRRARLTATIHDVTTALMPELHTEGNIRADRDFAERILGKADRIIAVSENTRRDAIKHWRLDPGKIVAIHSGVPDAYFDARPSRRAKPYVLFAGTIEPRKNIARLLDAWKSVRPELREAYDLVIAGPIGWAAEAVGERVIRESMYLGYVPEPDMPALFAGASVLAYPSLYEGFGFPVAQAMAAGVPVVTSTTSCLPEIAGDGALYADPLSESEIKSQLERLLDSQELRNNIGTRGRAKAQQYRWEICAKKSLGLFASLA